MSSGYYSVRIWARSKHRIIISVRYTFCGMRIRGVKIYTCIISPAKHFCAPNSTRVCMCKHNLKLAFLFREIFFLSIVISWIHVEFVAFKWPDCPCAQCSSTTIHEVFIHSKDTIAIEALHPKLNEVIDLRKISTRVSTLYYIINAFAAPPNTHWNCSTFWKGSGKTAPTFRCI